MDGQEELNEAYRLIDELTQGMETYRLMFEKLLKPCIAMCMHAGHNAVEFWRAVAEVKQVVDSYNA